MQTTFLEFISQPFVIGLLIGLAIALFIWISGLMKMRGKIAESNEKIQALRGEISKLQTHLHTQMEISAKGNEGIREELEELKRQNDNLKSVVAALKGKPGRAELRTLHLYEKAIRLMNSRAPGFGPVWESVMVDAESEIKKEESGLLSWIRKPFILNKAQEIEDTRDSKPDNSTASPD